jgi:hypothetical protein
MPASPRLQALLRPAEVNQIAALLEPAAAIASSTVAEPVSGIAALLTGNPDNIGRVQKAMTFNPRTPEGRAGMKAIAGGFQQIVDIAGLERAVEIFEGSIVPALQKAFGTEVGSAIGAGVIGAASVAGPRKAKIPEVKPNVDVKDLQFLHNTSPAKIARHQSMGGMPMPSLAVTRQDIPFEGFGDITLVGDPSKFDPKRSRANVVYDADAYTVRAPSPIRQAKKGGYKKLNEEFGDIAKKYDGYLDEAKYLLADLETKKGISSDKYSTIERFFENNVVTDIAFLQEKGITDIPLRQYGTNTAADGRKISEMVAEYGQERKDWANSKINQYFDPDEVFVSNPDRDYYTTGAKLKPYTADEVTKFMKRKRGAGQESTMTTGVGMVRANLAKELKSLPEIRSEKGRLVTAEDVAEFKSEMDSTLIDLQDTMQPFYKYDAGGFRYRDEVGEMIYDSDRIGLEKAFEKYGFENVGSDVRQSIADYKSRLRSGPTEYFEAKPGRAVDFSEFVGAIVPVSTPESTVNALKKAGLQIEYYQGEFERLDARMKFPGTAFSIAGGIVLTQQAKESETDATAKEDPSV